MQEAEPIRPAGVDAERGEVVHAGVPDAVAVQIMLEELLAERIFATSTTRRTFLPA